MPTPAPIRLKPILRLRCKVRKYKKGAAPFIGKGRPVPAADLKIRLEERDRRLTRLAPAARRPALDRDGHICAVPGCGATAMFVDHVISRRNGGPDNLANLRCLCAHHDSQIKENSSGKRKNNGKPYLVGCDGNGRPLDPEHWWNR
ncbi:MAG: HNH endonuclease signature motif containing protein [Pseudolabrys sp.]